MKCGLCKFTPKGKRDMDRHVREIHKLTWAQYTQAVEAIAPALGQISMIRGAMRKAGMLTAALAMLALGGCRGVDRLLGNDDSNDSPAPTAPVSALGAWSGSGTLQGDVTVDGKTFTMDIDVPTQAGASVSGTWALLVPNSDDPMGPPPFPAASGTIAGTIDAAGHFTYALTESPSCVGQGTATVTGNSMTVTWTGTGNPSCNLWFDAGAGTLNR